MNSNLSILLQRLSWLRLALVALWLVFLTYLQLNHFANLAPAWLLLACYVGLLLVGAIQAKHNAIHTHWNLLIHLVIECQLLTGLLFFSGGVSNPLISCFLLLLVFAAYSLPRKASLAVTIIALIDYSVLTQWYLPLLNHHQHTITSSSLFSLHLAGMWLTFVISALIFASLIPLLIKASRVQQNEIQKLREQQLKNEQLVGIATLAAGTAHEMGTPLMTMQLLLEELEHNIGSPLDSADLNLLKHQVAQCRESLRQLTLAGRETHQSGNHAALNWLHSLLQRWTLSHPNAVWVNADLTTDACIPASPLLNQALLNLLDNAAEAGLEPIQLSSKIEQHFWQLHIYQSDPNAANQLQQNAVFNSKKEHGMGLGLYLSNASVEQFGGAIFLSTQADGGSLSILQLPIISTKATS